MANRRDQMKMTADEVEAFLDGRRTMNIATIGPTAAIRTWWPCGTASSTAQPAFWTFAKSQKILNLRRDPKITALVEDGDTYDQLQGVELVGTARIVEDVPTHPRDRPVGRRRYPGPAALTPEALPFLEAQAAKRLGVVIEGGRQLGPPSSAATASRPR